uniref:Uncharacterized protein n=1 Tax=Utricularia reniformis TaxID=192314 RepID=A0A1Y0B3W2_9LAMI|nr:hypothetical protein AEK19_MT1899 [Utricularia reniformis]ART32067.1 hypothetical protein AEK19_MT1899 [Utricularia reniformis]
MKRKTLRSVYKDTAPGQAKPTMKGSQPFFLASRQHSERSKKKGREKSYLKQGVHTGVYPLDTVQPFCG